jgi:peptidoglycan/LPS O-acetylase OafA/YrhL
VSRLSALDGLRGLAALNVVALHVSGGAWPASGGLAVDLFFMLSGFVLAAVYEPRLRTGLTAGAFCAARLARLWPVYLAGVGAGLAVYLPAGGAAALAGAANAVFVRGPFWVDGPLWSLALEIAVNVAFAAGLWRLSDTGLAILASASAAVLALAWPQLGSLDFGWQAGGPGRALGYARVFYGFPLGWLIWRRRQDIARLCTARASLIAAAGAAASFFVPASAAQLIALFALYPLAVAALALGPQPQGTLGRVALIAGALSYPLYALHAPVVILARSAGAPLLALPLALAIAWAAHRTIEPAGRRLLNRIFTGLASSPASQPERTVTHAYT